MASSDERGFLLKMTRDRFLNQLVLWCLYEQDSTEQQNIHLQSTNVKVVFLFVSDIDQIRNWSNVFEKRKHSSRLEWYVETVPLFFLPFGLDTSWQVVAVAEALLSVSLQEENKEARREWW